MGSPRPVVLVAELLGPGRLGTDKGRIDPFPAGFVRARGVEVDWVCIPFDERAATTDPCVVDLGERGRGWLAERIRRGGVTHALLSEAVTPDLEAYPKRSCETARP